MMFKSRMDIARICLRYKGKDKVYSTIKVVVNGLSFEVHMLEEDHLSRMVVSGRREWEDVGSDSAMSSEGEDGTSEGMVERV